MAVNNYQENAANASTSVTISSYVVGSESDRILTVVCTSNDGSDNTFSGVTFGAAALTEDVTRTDTNGGFRYRTSIWRLLSPAASTANIVATCSVTADALGVQAVYLDGQSGAAEVTATAQSTGAPPILVTIGAGLTQNAVVVYGCIAEGSSPNISALTGSGATLAGDIEIDTTFSVFSGLATEVAGVSGSETGGFGHNSAGTFQSNTIAASYAPAGGAAATPKGPLGHPFHGPFAGPIN